MRTTSNRPNQQLRSDDFVQPTIVCTGDNSYTGNGFTQQATQGHITTSLSAAQDHTSPPQTETAQHEGDSLALVAGFCEDQHRLVTQQGMHEVDEQKQYWGESVMIQARPASVV